MDGLSATREICRLESSGVSVPWRVPLPVVALTGNAGATKTREALAAGTVSDCSYALYLLLLLSAWACVFPPTSNSL